MIKTRLVTNGSLFRDGQVSANWFRIIDRLDISYRTVDDMEVQIVQKKLTHEQYLDMVMAAVDLRAAMADSTTDNLRLQAYPFRQKYVPRYGRCVSVCRSILIRSSIRRRAAWQPMTSLPRSPG